MKINLCQVVTQGELFRITTDLEVKMDTVKAGDFQGLVNAKGLSISANSVETGAFTGMESLKWLQLSGRTIATGAFQGLPRLEIMTLEFAANGSIKKGAFRSLLNLEALKIVLSETSSDEDTFAIPDFDGMPNLKHITIQWYETNTVASSPFSELPNLESAEIYIHFKDDEPEGKKFRIPSDMFTNNPKLKNIKLVLPSNENAGIYASEDLFANNPLMEEIWIESDQTRVPTDTLKHLKNLKVLKMHEYLTEDGWKHNEIELHQSSPLFSVITLGGQRPRGFSLVEEN